MIQFNLLPDVKKEYIKAKRTKRLIMSASTLVVAGSIGVVILLFGFQLAQKKNISDLTDDISRGVTELQSIENLNKILTIQHQLEALPTLHEGKSASSRLFSYLTQITPADVKIRDVSINLEENTITIEGSAPSLASVNRYTDTIKFAKFTATDSTQDAGGEAAEPSEAELAFSDVLTELSRNEEQSSYKITAVFDPVIFDNTQVVVLIIPDTVTTRSTQGKPTISDTDSNPLFETDGGQN